jgi:hypothetical protein
MTGVEADCFPEATAGKVLSQAREVEHLCRHEEHDKASVGVQRL